MVWLVLTILVVVAIALPVVFVKTSPPTDPWFEERWRDRDERARMFRPKEKRWWDRILGVVVLLAICVALPIFFAGWLAVDAGRNPEYGLAVLAALVVFAEAMFLFVISKRGDDYHARLQADRTGFTQADYLAHFARFGVRPEAALEVREHLQVRWADVPDFAVMPSDGLSDIYRMDVGEEIDGILEDCLCREPTKEDWEATSRLDTVEDFVLLVDRLYVGLAVSRSPT